MADSVNPAGDLPADDVPLGDVPLGDPPVGHAPVGDPSVGHAPVGDAPVDSYAMGVTVLHALRAELPTHPPVTGGRMFNGEGLQVRKKFFAFIGRNGDLVAKVPESRVRELVALGAGAPVVMGRRTMREWVRLPAEAGVGAWSEVLDEAYRFGLTRP